MENRFFSGDFSLFLLICFNLIEEEEEEEERNYGGRVELDLLILYGAATHTCRVYMLRCSRWPRTC